MRILMLGIAGLAIVAPPALAQQPPGPPPTSAVSQQTEPGRYWVFFEFDRSELRPEAREVVAEAAELFKRTGPPTFRLSATPTARVRRPTMSGYRFGVPMLSAPSWSVWASRLR